MDKYIFTKITNDIYIKKKYPQYFYPEIEPFIQALDKVLFDKKFEINDDFYIKRRIGQNDDYVCGLIQKDSIEDFIIYVKKNICSLNYQIDTSLFETNQLLLKEKVNLIEYAAFYGSISIFNYLKLNGIKLTQSLMKYAIHGQNAEMIHILNDEFADNITNNLYYEYYKESIKCHHSDVANYFLNNYLNYDKIENSFDNFAYCIKYHNFIFMNPYYVSQSSLYELCIYDYPLFIYLLLKNCFIDINHVIILNDIF